MKIEVEISIKETADLVAFLQNQLGEKFSKAVVDAFIQKCHSEIHENDSL